MKGGGKKTYFDKNSSPKNTDQAEASRVGPRPHFLQFPRARVGGMGDPTLTGHELLTVLQQQGIAKDDPRVQEAFAFLQERIDTALSKEELSDVTKKVE